jgi:RHS repeat-associated protein
MKSNARRLSWLGLGVGLAFLLAGADHAAAQYRPGFKKYDHQGRLVAAADERGQLWKFVHEADGSQRIWFDGREVGLERADGTVEAYAYDARGRKVRTRISGKGAAPRYVDHPPSRQVGRSTPIPAPRPVAARRRGGGAGTSGTVYARDGLGRLTSVTTAQGTTHYRYFEGVDAPLIAEVTHPRGSSERFDLELSRVAYEAFATPSPRARGSAPSGFVPELCAAPGNRFAFGAYLYECELGLYFTPSGRMYDPEVGRFTSQDSYLGQVDDPPSLHRYLYANANPLRYVDPTGHQSIGAGSEYCRAYTCSPEVQHAVAGGKATKDAVNEATDAGVRKADFVVSTAVVHVWNQTGGNPGHNANPAVLVPYPTPKNDAEALLGAATMLAVDVSPAVVRGGNRARSTRVPPHEPRPGTTPAQFEANVRAGITEGTVLESPSQLSSKYRDAWEAAVSGDAPPPAVAGGSQGAGAPATGPGSTATRAARAERLAGSKLEHINAAIAEQHGYAEAIRQGHLPIRGPGKTTARGADYVTYDPVQQEVVLWDSKYRGPQGGSTPRALSPAKIERWTPEARRAIGTLPDGPSKADMLQAIDAGQVRGEIFRWPN